MEPRVISPIVPATTIHILRGVPLDNTYTDTLDFASVSAQTTYFLGKVKYSNVAATPVRMQNKIRVDKTADHLYDCNYIMFNNANYEGKWFYAFITSIDFINTNMCEIGFELDVYQSWWPNITIHPSFVVREHANNDTVGSNLVPESLEHGDYIFKSQQRTGHLDTNVIAVASTVDLVGNDVAGDMYGGVYSGVSFQFFPTSTSGVTSLNEYIDMLTTSNKSDAIVSISMFPSDFQSSPEQSPREYSLSFAKNLGTIDGYTPKNNKLYVYPYNFLYVYSTSGTSAEMPYEYFSGSTCDFTLMGDKTCNPNILLYPNNYKGIANNLNEKMVLEGYPQCAYNIDSFKAWLAQNGSSTAISVMSSAFSAASSVMYGNGLGAIGSAASIAQELNQVMVQSTRPPQANGAQGTSVQAGAELLDFYFCQATIRAEFARIIDEYFSMYGYATHRVKVPNITGRQSWNYVKTIDARITGSVPFADLAQLKRIFNAGITFWHGDYVGDYTRSNNIV